VLDSANKTADAGQAVETPAPVPETPETACSSPDWATVQAGRDIRLRQRVIRKYEKDERAALRDMAKRGASVLEERCDSHGKAHAKLVPNPSIRIARQARAAINQLQKEIARIGLEVAAATTQAVAKELSGLERLAARAGKLRKP
jgi:hypothetical protein